MDRLPRGLRPHPPTRALLHRVPLRLVRRRQMGSHAKNERPLDQGSGAVDLGVITSCSLLPLPRTKLLIEKTRRTPTSTPQNTRFFAYFARTREIRRHARKSLNPDYLQDFA